MATKQVNNQQKRVVHHIVAAEKEVARLKRDGAADTAATECLLAAAKREALRLPPKGDRSRVVLPTAKVKVSKGRVMKVVLVIIDEARVDAYVSSAADGHRELHRIPKPETKSALKLLIILLTHAEVKARRLANSRVMGLLRLNSESSLRGCVSRLRRSLEAVEPGLGELIVCRDCTCSLAEPVKLSVKGGVLPDPKTGRYKELFTWIDDLLDHTGREAIKALFAKNIKSANQGGLA